MRFEAEIVATGDELMTGAVVDTNSAFTEVRLRGAGVSVRRVTTVGDALGEIEAALREASSRVPVVIVSGGLGPTEDDRTAEAAAKVAGVPLTRSEAALDHVKAMFRRFGREMTPNNAKQADFPQGAEMLDNPIGTAPGFTVKLGSAAAFFLPGVPREHEKMLVEQVLPRVAKLREAAGTTTSLATRVVKTYGYGESKVEHELRGIDWPAEITVGYRAAFPEIHLRLYAEGTGEKLGPALDRAEQAIRERLGIRVFGLDDATMAGTLGALLEAKRMKLALAESCTGGLLGALITEVSGSSAWFDRGWVTYSNPSKQALLGVPEAVLAEKGAVSEETVRAMATGARERSGCDVALAITGIAGPTGGTPEKPVGLVWIACATALGVETRRLDLGGVGGAARPPDGRPTGGGTPSEAGQIRERIRRGAAWAAMDLGRRTLLGGRT